MGGGDILTQAILPVKTVGNQEAKGWSIRYYVVRLFCKIHDIVNDDMAFSRIYIYGYGRRAIGCVGIN